MKFSIIVYHSFFSDSKIHSQFHQGTFTFFKLYEMRHVFSYILQLFVVPYDKLLHMVSYDNETKICLSVSAQREQCHKLQCHFLSISAIIWIRLVIC